MKFSRHATLFLAAISHTLLTSHAQHEGELECTHGTLYMSDVDAAQIHIFDLDDGLVSLQVESTLDVPGNPGQVLAVTGSGTNIASMFRGTASIFFTDGRVNFINTGVITEEHGDHFEVIKGPASLLTNAGFDCARPIHFVNHDNKVAIFCDGSFAAMPEQINSTVWVLDEELMGTTGSAIVFSETLQGSHHGVAIPVDDDHVLHSLALPERIAGQASSSLPDTFQVVDYDGNVLQSLDDPTDPSKSCSGFHGESTHPNTFSLACDDEHGGVLIVDYQPTSSSYTSRALSYPLDEHRTGTFADHPDSPMVVGNFAGENTEFHLIAFNPMEQTSIDMSHIQTLEARQCSFAFEKADGELLLVWLPSGKLQVYEVEPEWKLVEELQVIPDMVACTEASMVAGYSQAFIVAAPSQKLYALDLKHVHEGEGIEMYESDLGFTPNSAIVAGVPDGFACSEDGEHGDHDTSSAFSFSVINAALVVSIGLLTYVW